MNLNKIDKWTNLKERKQIYKSLTGYFVLLFIFIVISTLYNPQASTELITAFAFWILFIGILICINKMKSLYEKYIDLKKAYLNDKDIDDIKKIKKIYKKL